jgi:hypothetical protein
MRFKLFRVVSPLDGGKWGTLTFPPISTGILYTYQRDHGFDVDQDDLHRRWFSTVSERDRARLLLLADDEKRMWRYLAGGDDPDWEWFGEKVVSLSDFSGYDGFLLSMISSDLGCCVASLAFARYLKRRFAKTIVLGGEYHAHAPIYDELEKVLPLGTLDYYVMGFGEEPLARLLGVLTGGTPEDELTAIPGLCFIYQGRTRKNPYGTKHPIVPPDFEGLPIDLYRWSPDCPPPDPSLPMPLGELTLPFHTSTGCPYNCSFCECSGMAKMTILPPKTTAAKLEQLVDRYGCQTFFFLDNTFNISPRYINELCDCIIASGLEIKWTACASGRGMDRDTLEKMRRAGAIRLVWGFESGSDRILEFVRKPVRTTGLANVLKMSHDAGIWNGLECIVGMPSETEDEFRATMDFLERHVDVLDEVYTYQFYLNSVSDMLTNHERYGITNVRRVNVGLTKDAVYGAVAASHVFDEKDGLSWPEIDLQQKRRLGIMLEHVAKLGLYPMVWEHEQQPNLLSWCYRQCQTKAEVRSLYRRYWERLALRRTWEPTGNPGDTVTRVAEEIYQKILCSDPSASIDEIWQSVYPDKWSPFFPQSEVTADLSYERRLLMDGRFHDSLVFSYLRSLLENGHNIREPIEKARL